MMLFLHFDKQGYPYRATLRTDNGKTELEAWETIELLQVCVDRGLRPTVMNGADGGKIHLYFM